MDYGTGTLRYRNTDWRVIHCLSTSLKGAYHGAWGTHRRPTSLPSPPRGPRVQSGMPLSVFVIGISSVMRAALSRSCGKSRALAPTSVRGAKDYTSRQNFRPTNFRARNDQAQDARSRAGYRNRLCRRRYYGGSPLAGRFGMAQ
jgi:hypothetical protein